MSTSFDGFSRVRAFDYPLPRTCVDEICVSSQALDAAQREAEARETGLREGEQRGLEQAHRLASRERQAIAECLRDFAREREQYYTRVESEVVRLAIAVARKVLEREAKTDPLTLTGAVRAALSKIKDVKRARLRVAPSRVPLWRAYFAEHTDVSAAPDVVPDESLEAEACILDSELGSIELGIDAQLREIAIALDELGSNVCATED